MSIYLQNLNPNITADIHRGGITFRSGYNVVDMCCQFSGRKYIMEFTLSAGVKTIIKARSAKEVRDKLAPTINDIFRLNSLKGMI